MPQKKERVARLLETLERDDILIIPSSKTRLTLRLAICLIFLTISTMLIAFPTFEREQPCRSSRSHRWRNNIRDHLWDDCSSHPSTSIAGNPTDTHVRRGKAREQGQATSLKKRDGGDIDQFTPILSQSPLQT